MIYTMTLNPAIDYHIVKTEDNHIISSYMVPGGKGINVSQMLSHLGVSSVSMGFLGGFTGDYIKNTLMSEKNMHLDFVEIKESTRINIKMHEPTEIAYNHIGPKVSLENIKTLLDKIEVLDQHDLVIMSGRGLPLHDDIYDQLVKLCYQKHMDFVLDIYGEKLKELVSYKPLLVKPNLEELSDAFKVSISNKEEAIHYGKKLQALGATYVMVSMGKEGSVFITKDQIYQALPIHINEISSVGAGDAMVAGFIKAYQEKQDIKTCYQYAVASATATAMSKDMASLDLVLDMFNQIVIKELNHEDF